MAAKSVNPVEEDRVEAPRSRTARDWVSGTGIKVLLLSGGLWADFGCYR